jgi:glycosyltransferase involved in cell wall biosynthesis
MVVLPAFPLRHTHFFSRAARKLAARIRGESYLIDREPHLLRGFAREASRKFQGQEFDVVFSPSTLPLAYLETDKPLTVCADATFQSMLDYYPSFSRLDRVQREFAEDAERRVLQRASLLIYPSKWAAESAISHYGAAAERVVVQPSGANFGANNHREDVMRWIDSRRSGEIRLLFIGKHWKRKGGEIAFDTMRILRDSGVTVRLDIVGCTPPEPAASHEKVVVHGLLSISNEAQRKKLDSLFAQAHFLVVPSRAEAYGMIFCEANAFGVPAISTDTGGISTIIRDGINGYKLPLEAGAAEYATLVAEIAGDTIRYQDLAQSSFGEFESRLNWEKWIETYLRIVSRIVANRSISLDV